MSTMQRGFCATCQTGVDVDGRPISEDESEWSHMKVVTWEYVGMGHAPGCYGDCDKHGCPVPEPMLEQKWDECGPVLIVRCPICRVSPCYCDTVMEAPLGSDERPYDRGRQES